MDAKTAYLVFPFIAAAGWAVLYSVSGRNYNVISVPTGVFMSGMAYVLAAFVLAFFLKQPVEVGSMFKSGPNTLLLWAAPAACLVGACFQHLSIKYVSATYAAVGEIAYVVLTPLFVFWFFSQKEWNTEILVGGALILAGLGVVVFGQHQMQG
jgi:drug/metabolite transporter (DMT)-like permease